MCTNKTECKTKIKASKSECGMIKKPGRITWQMKCLWAEENFVLYKKPQNYKMKIVPAWHICMHMPVVEVQKASLVLKHERCPFLFSFHLNGYSCVQKYPKLLFDSTI